MKIANHHRRVTQRKLLLAARQCLLSIGIAAMAIAVFPMRSVAQSIWVQGGTSTMMDAHGGELAYRWGEVGGYLSMGYSTRLDIGGYTGFKWKGYSVGLGDRYQTFTLDTDNFETGHYFYGRGVSVSRKLENGAWTAFGGATTLQSGSILYRGFRAEQASGAFFYTGELSKRLSFHSANLVQEGITSLQSMRFRLREDLSVSAAAGVGDNEPYAAASTDYTSKYVEGNASYITAGHGFQRITGTPMGSPERIGANARVKITPSRRFSVNLEHSGFVLGEYGSRGSGRTSTLNSAMAMTSIRNFSISGVLTSSRSGEMWTKTQSVTASRNVFGDMLRLSGTRMHQNSGGGWDSTTYMATADEKISPRLRLQQNYARTGKTNTISGGGQFVSNPITVGVNHQIVYTPLAGASTSIIRAWTLNVNARIWGSIRLHVDSYLDPSGRVRYTTWLDGLHFGGGDGSDNPQTRNVSVEFGKFVVKGVVIDEKGQPVWGIAVQVDGKMAYSDSTGRFLIRFRRGETYPVTLLPEQSLSTLLYEGIEVPVSARAETDNIAPLLTIRVRRAHMQPAPTPLRRKRADLDGNPVPEPGEENRPSETIPAESNDKMPESVANMPDLAINHHR